MRTLVLIFVVMLVMPSALQAQNGENQRPAQTAKNICFTDNHKSFIVLLGLSTLFNVAPFIQSVPGVDRSGSFAVGPVSILFNQGLSKNVSLYVGPTAMFYRDKYVYKDNSVIPGAANMILVGILGGLNYHFATTTKIDPYVGGGAGVGYFTSSSGADNASLRLKGETKVLYNAKLGLNAYTKKNNAWTFEAGYDYLSYVKVGYTFVKHK